MSLNKKINGTVAIAKNMVRARVQGIMDAEEENQADYVEDPSVAKEIIAQHEWLCKNFKQVQVNLPGTRLRMGWSAESLKAMEKAFA